MRRWLGWCAAATFLAGVGSLALTLYLWFGDWPREIKSTVDHLRSARENAGRAPDPLLQNPLGRDHTSLNGNWQAVIDPYDRGAFALLTPFSSRYARQVMLDNMDRIRFVTAGGKPLIVSEFGAGAKAGLHAHPGEMRMYSEEYQAEVYRRQLAMLERQDNVRGLSPWILKDFRAPLRMYQGVQDYWNRKGLISETGERKLAFGVLRDHYARIADPIHR